MICKICHKNETDSTSGICDNHNKWQKVCPVCGKSFETKYIIKKYCCSRCCYKANYSYGKKTKKAVYNCQSCGGKMRKTDGRTIFRGNEYALWKCKGCRETMLVLKADIKK